MHKYTKFLSILLVLGGAALLCYALFMPRPVKFAPSEERLIRFDLQLENMSRDPIENSEVVVFAPLAEGAGFRRTGLTVSLPFRTELDAAGNETIKVSASLPPFGRKILSVEAALKVASKPRIETVSGDSLHSETLVESDAPEIVAQSLKLRGSSTLESARSIFEWVREHVSDNGYVEEDRGALRAFREKSGDCTEFTSLFVALARAAGIPARRMAGFVAEQNKVLRAADYHNWAEFYDGESWQVADPQRGVFAERAGDYIGFRILTPDSQLSTSQRFLALDKRIRASL